MMNEKVLRKDSAASASRNNPGKSGDRSAVSKTLNVNQPQIMQNSSSSQNLKAYASNSGLSQQNTMYNHNREKS
jgi:hypothetical protein